MAGTARFAVARFVSVLWGGRFRPASTLSVIRQAAAHILSAVSASDTGRMKIIKRTGRCKAGLSVKF